MRSFITLFQVSRCITMRDGITYVINIYISFVNNRQLTESEAAQSIPTHKYLQHWNIYSRISQKRICIVGQTLRLAVFQSCLLSQQGSDIRRETHDRLSPGLRRHNLRYRTLYFHKKWEYSVALPYFAIIPSFWFGLTKKENGQIWLASFLKSSTSIELMSR